MPNCGYLEKYTIHSKKDEYHVALFPAGEIDVCRIMANAFPRTKVVMIQKEIGFLHIKKTVEISGVLPQIEELHQFLGLLSNHLTINDSLDECHALALRSVPPTEDASEWKRTKMGELVYRAKYKQDEAVGNAVADRMTKFIAAHPRYKRAKHLIAAPPSQVDTKFDLPRIMVMRIASTLQKAVAIAKRTRQTNPQKELWKEGDIDLLQTNVKDSMTVRTSLNGASVILIDETYGSGATLGELRRACRAAGAAEVLGLAATKNAKFTYGIDLSEAPWK